MNGVGTRVAVQCPVPELPEVETHARNLASWARGRRILEVTPPPGTRETGGVAADDFVGRLRGRRVEAIARRGKWILVRLSGGAGLGLHLGMSGSLVRQTARSAALPRFSRASFRLDDGSEIHFVDRRRFGKLLAVERYEDLSRLPEITSLGPDALAELTADRLRAALARTARTVKEALLDQHLVAGIGNLYATEALWIARIHPATPAAAVAAGEATVRRLLKAIRAALEHGLTTYGGPRYPRYAEEGGPTPFDAYGRAGEPCRRCGAPLSSMSLGGRTTVFCARCQPAPSVERAVPAPPPSP